MGKVDAVRTSTAATPSYDVPFKATTSRLGSWTAVTVDEVEKLIASALNKTCQLDPAPTWLVKEMLGLLAAFVALLLTKSLDTGCFPAEFKQAVVRPLLKKSGLDTAEMKNNRPVSNLQLVDEANRFHQGRQRQHSAVICSGALLFSSRVLRPSLVTLCSHKLGRCAVELYHASHLWYPPFYTSPMASSALQH